MFQLVLCGGEYGWVQTQGAEVPFAGLRTILIPPGTLHRFAVETGEIAHMKVVCFPPKDLPRYLPPLHISMLDGLAAAGVTATDHDGQESWMRHLADSISDGFGMDDIWAQRLQWGALGLLLTLHAKKQNTAWGHTLLRHKAKIKEIMSWIEGNLTEHITIERISDQFAISRSLLTREFRGHTGKSLVGYCNGRRVQKAAIALATTEAPVIDIALDCGFSNISHFHRQFKSRFGITPAVFRRKISEEGSI
ncbi:helix-turn-helix transcriptional regulator [Bordetella petrii]|nr:AraC family transcriptional regulator [Bordetella petrii]